MVNITKHYTDYLLFWSFYHFIIGKIFLALSMVFTSLDRRRKKLKVFPIMVRSMDDRDDSSDIWEFDMNQAEASRDRL